MDITKTVGISSSWLFDNGTKNTKQKKRPMEKSREKRDRIISAPVIDKKFISLLSKLYLVMAFHKIF
jgi:hypothetical protein